MWVYEAPGSMFSQEAPYRPCCEKGVGRSANQRVPMHELCYSKLGAAVNKLIPQMTSSTGTKVVDHPAIDALRRRTHSTNCLELGRVTIEKINNEVTNVKRSSSQL